MPSPPVEAAQDDESVPPAEPVAASRRWALIVGALRVTAAVWIVATGGPFDSHPDAVELWRDSSLRSHDGPCGRYTPPPCHGPPPLVHADREVRLGLRDRPEQRRDDAAARCHHPIAIRVRLARRDGRASVRADAVRGLVRCSLLASWARRGRDTADLHRRPIHGTGCVR